MKIIGKFLLIFFILAVAILTRLEGEAAEPLLIRAAHMPNVTHAQAVVGRAVQWFEKKLGNDVHVEWQTFNAGPLIIEAIFGDRIDIAYIGPGPAINGYVKSGGEALRVVAGAASGGAAFVVRKGAGIHSEKDLPGKRIATPQHGNTQDIALRGWLMKAGLKPREKGGTVTILPIANPDQFTLFVKGELDGAWTVEPWVSRLVQDAGAEVLFEESMLWSVSGGKYATTLLIVRKKFLAEHPKIVADWIRAHVELTTWINANRSEAMEVFNQELGHEIGKPLAKPVLEGSFSRLEFTPDPLVYSLHAYAKTAYELGFLGKAKPDLKDLCTLNTLQEIMQVTYDILAGPRW